MNETNHIVAASIKDFNDTLHALQKRWPQVTFDYGGLPTVTVWNCPPKECKWENDPDAPAGEKGTRCSVCGNKTPF